MAKLEMNANNLEAAKEHLMSILAVDRFNMEAVTVGVRDWIVVDLFDGMM